MSFLYRILLEQVWSWEVIQETDGLAVQSHQPCFLREPAFKCFAWTEIKCFCFVFQDLLAAWIKPDIHTKWYFKHVSAFLSVYAYFVFKKIAVDLFLYMFNKQGIAQLVLPSYAGFTEFLLSWCYSFGISFLSLCTWCIAQMLLALWEKETVSLRLRWLLKKLWY